MLTGVFIILVLHQYGVRDTSLCCHVVSSLNRDWMLIIFDLHAGPAAALNSIELRVHLGRGDASWNTRINIVHEGYWAILAHGLNRNWMLSRAS